LHDGVKVFEEDACISFGGIGLARRGERCVDTAGAGSWIAGGHVRAAQPYSKPKYEAANALRLGELYCAKAKMQSGG
jgi:hypothetical protein